MYIPYSLFIKSKTNNAYYNFYAEKIIISETVYGTNNSEGDVSAIGYSSFKLPKNTKIEFTIVRES